MSQRELDRIQVIEKRRRGELSQEEASKELGISPRQMRRLEVAYEENGAGAIAHKSRGRPSNNQADPKAMSRLEELIEDGRYRDFGPTLLSEELKREGLNLGKEKVRLTLIQRGLWVPQSASSPVVHPRRARRSSLGELSQMDGSPHPWFEERGKPCALLVSIDDATSRLEALRFEPTETLQGYWRLMSQQIEANGVPRAIYTDRHAVFKVNRSSALDHETQFRRSMKQLGVEAICALTPQAKGRVERVNRTLQDRLVKYLRLRKISAIEDANHVLLEYMKEHNDRFAISPYCQNTAYRSLLDPTLLVRAFSIQSERIVAKDLSFSFEGNTYVLENIEMANRLRGSKVQILQGLDGVMECLWNELPLRWHLYGQSTEVMVPVDHKDLGLATHMTNWANRRPPMSTIQQFRRTRNGG